MYVETAKCETAFAFATLQLQLFFLKKLFYR